MLGDERVIPSTVLNAGPLRRAHALARSLSRTWRPIFLVRDEIATGPLLLSPTFVLGPGIVESGCLIFLGILGRVYVFVIIVSANCTHLLPTLGCARSSSDALERALSTDASLHAALCNIPP